MYFYAYKNINMVQKIIHDLITNDHDEDTILIIDTNVSITTLISLDAKAVMLSEVGICLTLRYL